MIEKIRKRNSKICGSQILLLASRVILHVRDHIMVELGLSLNVLSFKPVQLALIRSSCLSRVSSLEGVHRQLSWKVLPGTAAGDRSAVTPV